jgi:hypothetical protein
MNVDISMEVQGISESEIVNELNGISYIAYCLRFQFVDLTTNEVQEQLDYEVIVGVDLTGNIGITGFLADEEQDFKADSYFCDEAGRVVTPSGPLIQGKAVRICVSPDGNTQNFGVVINRINNMFLLREDSGVSRALIRDRGVVEDTRVTQVDCRTSSVVCSVSTTPSNAFYTSDGVVVGVGEVVLMYNYDTRRRRTVRVPFEFGHRRTGNLAGLDAGNYTFRVAFDVKPAEPIHEARMFRCNELNRELTEEEQRESLYRGDAVRVCAFPDDFAIASGVSMYEVNSFTFTQTGEHAQVAVSEGGNALGGTVMLCQSGDPVCVFKTYLNDDFFDEGIPIQGKGEFRLQYGDERVPVFDTEDGVNPAVAGSSVREFSFTITLDDPPPGRNSNSFDDAENWWKNTPPAMRFLYILAFIIIILLCLLCFFILLCGVPAVFNKKEKELEDEEFFRDAPFIPPNAVRSNVQDNPDFCDALANPEEYYADPNAEYVPNQSRSNAEYVPNQSRSNAEYVPNQSRSNAEYVPNQSRSMPTEDVPEDEVPEDEPAPLLALTYGEKNRSFRGGASKEPSESSFYSKSPGTPGRKPKVSTNGKVNRESQQSSGASRPSTSSERVPRPVKKKRDPSLSLATDAPEEAPTSGRKPRKSRKSEASNTSQTPDQPSKKKKKKKKSSRISKVDEGDTNEE